MNEKPKFKIDGEIVVSILFIILGCIVMKMSYGYGLWKKISPSKGFMPFISAALMTICSIWWLINCLTNKNKEDNSFSKNEIKWMILIPGICFVTVFLMKWIGLYVALGIFLFVWFVIIDKFTIVKSLIFSVVLCVAFYLIFSLGLQVPVPKFNLF